MDTEVQHALAYESVALVGAARRLARAARVVRIHHLFLGLTVQPLATGTGPQIPQAWVEHAKAIAMAEPVGDPSAALVESQAVQEVMRWASLWSKHRGGEKMPGVALILGAASLWFKETPPVMPPRTTLDALAEAAHLRPLCVGLSSDGEEPFTLTTHVPTASDLERNTRFAGSDDIILLYERLKRLGDQQQLPDERRQLSREYLEWLIGYLREAG